MCIIFRESGQLVHKLQGMNTQKKSQRVYGREIVSKVGYLLNLYRTVVTMYTTYFALRTSVYIPHNLCMTLAWYSE
jgi:hypothetical protein